MYSGISKWVCSSFIKIFRSGLRDKWVLYASIFVIYNKFTANSYVEVYFWVRKSKSYGNGRRKDSLKCNKMILTIFLFVDENLVIRMNDIISWSLTVIPWYFPPLSHCAAVESLFYRTLGSFLTSSCLPMISVNFLLLASEYTHRLASTSCGKSSLLS